MMRRVDKIIAGNCYLESEAKRYNPNVVVIPTSIDTSRYSLKDDSPADRPPVVGWIGSSSTLKYLEEIAPALRAIYRRYRDITLKIVSDRFIDDPELPIVKKRWSSAEEVSDLKSFDIGLMPLSDDPWSRGKCGLKILQYFAVGIPVVCSPVGVNREIVQDGINGFWASREEEWEERIESLIVDGSLRREMGINGYMTLRKGFTLEVNAPRLLSVLKEVGKSH